MSSLNDIAKFVFADVRQGITVVSCFLLGLLLLFFKDLTPYFREILIPALVVYTLGTAILGHIQILVTMSENTKAQASGQTPSGIKKCHLRIIVTLHLLWLASFIFFISSRTPGDTLNGGINPEQNIEE